eukprot:TRINITY_DN38865_c0_g1_i1.p1 TRINITY_DN38865_c0_g1~~TRINITY_DN38865_c0_g1_i1.p1  ORF type:complete len:170 (+),score=20.15 TRINITY_DN38865_c0_g1_i1:75-584(+)
MREVNFIVVMGICGVGKSTVGEALAAELEVSFVEGDSWHPEENKAKMKNGTPLTDADREPWLRSINEHMRRLKKCVVACSALKEAYRQLLFADIPLNNTLIVYLYCSDEDILRKRMSSREGHFMPPSLIKSQLSVLEPPSDCLSFDVSIDDSQNIVLGIKSNLNRASHD